MTAAIQPLSPRLTRVISRPRAAAASSAWANGMTPAATSAPYSPSEWPITMSGAMPKSASRRMHRVVQREHGRLQMAVCCSESSALRERVRVRLVDEDVLGERRGPTMRVHHLVGLGEDLRDAGLAGRRVPGPCSRTASPGRGTGTPACPCAARCRGTRPARTAPSRPAPCRTRSRARPSAAGPAVRRACRSRHQALGRAKVRDGEAARRAARARPSRGRSSSSSFSFSCRDAGGADREDAAQRRAQDGAACEPPRRCARLAVAAVGPGPPTRRRRAPQAVEQPGHVLLEHDVEVGAAEPVGADAASARRAVGRGPLACLVGQVERRGREVDVRVGPLGVEGGRDRLVVQRVDRLEQAGRAGARLEVPDVALRRTEARSAARPRPRTSRRGSSPRRRRRPSCWCRAPPRAWPSRDRGRRPPRRAARRASDPTGFGRRDALALAVAGAGDATNHRVDAVAVALGVGQPLQQERAGALTHDEPVGPVAERPRAGRAERADLAELHEARRAHVAVDAAGEHGVAVTARPAGPSPTRWPRSSTRRPRR